MPAVVVAERLIDRQDDPCGVRVRAVGIVGGDAELRQVAGVVPVVRGAVAQFGAVVDDEAPVVGEVRVEGDAQQAALVVAGIEVDEAIGEIEERFAGELTVGCRPYLTGLIGDEESSAAVIGLG
jgi:hypothetical protein